MVTTKVTDAVLDVLAKNEPMSTRAVERAFANTHLTRSQVRAALRQVVAEGLVATEPGTYRSIMHRLVAHSAPTCEGCGAQLRRTKAIEAGRCERCRLGVLT